ncbi:DUF7504 family protein [Haladaptatus sp. NG-WS-4]
MSSFAPTIEYGKSILVTVQSLGETVRRTSFEHLPLSDVSSVVAVTYDQSAGSFLRTWRSAIDTTPTDVRIVDVGQTMRSTESVSPQQTSVHDVVRTVHQPGNLPRVANEITSALDESDGETLVLFDSLTTLFEHVSLAGMVTFFDSVSAAIADSEAVGYFYLETGSHDAPTVQTLRVLSDDTLELIDDGTEWSMRSLEDRTDDCPPLDVLFDSLRVQLRRDTLRYLLRTGEPVSVDELATAVAPDRDDDTGTTQNTLRRYYTALYQLHLPKLADAGLVEHDETSHRVSLRETVRWVEPFLALTDTCPR